MVEHGYEHQLLDEVLVVACHAEFRQLVYHRRDVVREEVFSSGCHSLSLSGLSSDSGAATSILAATGRGSDAGGPRTAASLERDPPDPVEGAEDPDCTPEEAEPPEPEVQP